MMLATMAVRSLPPHLFLTSLRALLEKVNHSLSLSLVCVCHFTTVNNNGLCCSSLSALPAPNVTISFSGNSIAGQSYSINCSATVVPGLVVEPQLEIKFSNLTLASDTSSVEHTFSPLKTSHGGQYTCTTTINIPQSGITTLNQSATGKITVAGECVCLISASSSFLSLCTVPEPTIRFTGRVVSPVDLPSTTLYSGTVFNLNCVVELVKEVDTNLSVTTVWAKNGAAISSDTGRISVDTEAAHNTFVVYVYESDVDFDPLSNAGSEGDGGNYTCSVTVETSEFTSGTTASGTQTITVEGITQYWSVQSHLTLLHRPGSSSSAGGV